MSDKKSSILETKLNMWVDKYITRVPFVEKILLVHNLYIMVKAGLSIVEGLRVLSEQVENKKLRAAVVEIKLQVEKGRSLSEVLSEFPTIFPPIYISMVAAGETAGKMEEALRQVHSQMKKSYEFSARIRGALMYPAVILIAMTGIGIEMMAVVLPKILVLFNDFNAQLPLPTRILIMIVNFVGQYGVWLGLIFIAIALILIKLERKPSIKRRVHAFNLKMPIFGTIVKRINLARFTLTLSSLLQSSVPIVEATGITSQVLGNVRYREDLEMVAEDLKKGVNLSESLAKFPGHFPPMVVQMIMIGEQSGQTEQMLIELSNYYESEVDNTMKNFSTIIEPIIILILGAAVAGIAVAVIMPMYSLAHVV